MEEFHDIFTRSNELIHVVDCRTKEEYDSCHISQAKSLEYYRLQNYGKLPIRTFFYSRIGERSAAVVEEELKKGVKAYNLNGGLVEWLYYCKFCDFPNGDRKTPINMLTKEYAMMVPSEYNVAFSE